MAMKFKESNLTEKQWEELGAELRKWATEGCYSKIIEKKETNPAMQYLQCVYGLKTDKTYEDVDFKENKLAYHTVYWIMCRQEENRLGAVEFDSIKREYEEFREKAGKCPECELDRVAYTKRAKDPALKNLEKLCEKYLKGIDVMKYIGGERK